MATSTKQIFYNNNLELLAILVAFANIFIGIIPVVPLTLGVVLILLFRIGYIGAFLVSALAISPVIGFVLYYTGAPSFAFLIEVVLFLVCLFQWIIKKTISFNNFKSVASYLLLILIVFSISSIISTGGDYAVIKLLKTAKTGFIFLFAFGFLFSNYEKCDLLRIGLSLILCSILMLQLSSLLNNGSGPEGFLDFGYMRTQNYLELNEDEVLVSYHYVGFLAVSGCSIMLLELLKTGLNNTFILICLGLSTLVSLYAGARQFVIISLIIYLMFNFSKIRKGKFGLVFLVIALALSLFFVSFLFNEGGMLNSVKEEGYMDASNRGGLILKAINDFMENPLFGVGFGRFEFFGEYGGYPHNMIIEILCEMGIMGFLLLFLLTFKPLKTLIFNYTPCVYLLIAFFFRSMASGGLDLNIMLFSYVFSVLCIKSKYQAYNKLK